MQTETQSIQNSLASLTDTRTGLPKPILTICILGFIGSALAVIGLLNSWSLLASVGTFFMLYYVVSVAGCILSLVWLWQMKKKGAYLYAALFITSQIVIAAYGIWAINLTFLVGLAVTAIALYYSKDMQ